MTSLLAPIAGPPESSLADHSLCGQLALSSVVRRLGGPAVSAPDNATATELAGIVNGLGAGWHGLVSFDAPGILLGQVIPQGRYLLVGVWCDGNANPVGYWTQTRHWLAAYGDAQQTPCYQCWTATYITADVNTDFARNPIVGCVIVWRDGVSPFPAPPHPVPPSTQEEPVLQRSANLGGVTHRVWIETTNGGLYTQHGTVSGSTAPGRLYDGVDTAFGISEFFLDAEGWHFDVKVTKATPGAADVGRRIEFTLAGDLLNWTWKELQ